MRQYSYCGGSDTSKYSTALEAQRACSSLDKCTMIYDYNCDAEGTWKTCTVDTAKKSGRPNLSCVWIKDKGMSSCSYVAQNP